MLDQLKSQIGSSMQAVRGLWGRTDDAGPKRRPPTGSASEGASRGDAASEPAAAGPTMVPGVLDAVTLPMQQSLYRLLTQHAQTRGLMRHIGLVERTLRREGMAAVEALPQGVIEQALEQLDRIVGGRAEPALVDLRLRLVLRVDAESAPGRAYAPTAPAALDITAALHQSAATASAEAKLPSARPLPIAPLAPLRLYQPVPQASEAIELTELTEHDRAAFEEMEMSWAGRLPPGAAEAIAAARRG